MSSRWAGTLLAFPSDPSHKQRAGQKPDSAREERGHLLDRSLAVVCPALSEAAWPVQSQDSKPGRSLQRETRFYCTAKASGSARFTQSGHSESDDDSGTIENPDCSGQVERTPEPSCCREGGKSQRKELDTAPQTHRQKPCSPLRTRGKERNQRVSGRSFLGKQQDCRINVLLSVVLKK